MTQVTPEEVTRFRTQLVDYPDAINALQVIEDYKIQLLIVTDENDKLVGVLHIHDLIEAGIK